MELAEFAKKQEEIYNKFRDNEKFKSTEMLNPNVKKAGGYLIAYRHDTGFAEKIAEFSEKVSSILPAIKYAAKDIHTTISDYMVSEEFLYDPVIIGNISDFIFKKKKELASPPITYNGFGFNSNTVIAMGQPNGIFLYNAELLNSKAHTFGLDIRLPWGAHITTNRFLKEMNAPEGIYELINSKGPGVSMPEIIDVGHFTLDENGFEFTVYERFHIDK